MSSDRGKARELHFARRSIHRSVGIGGHISREDGRPAADAYRAGMLRELAEETGHALVPGGELTYLGHYYSSQGYSDEMPHLFLARHVHPTDSEHAPDEHESIRECRAFSLESLRAMIADSVIQDANTLALFARLTAKNLIP